MNSKSIVLMENLLQRMELNKSTEVYTLRGAITADEYYTLTLALKALRNQDVEMDKKRGTL